MNHVSYIFSIYSQGVQKVSLVLTVENSVTVRMMRNVTQSPGNVYVYLAGMVPSVNKVGQCQSL